MLRFKDYDDMQAFNVLFKRYTEKGGKLNPKMRVWLMLRVGTEQDAEDVFQKAWAAISKNAGSYESKSKFHTYFLRVLDRKIIDKRRKPKGPKWKRPKYLGGKNPAKVQISRFTNKPLKPHEVESYDKESVFAQGYVGGEQEPIPDLENFLGATSTEDQAFWQECLELFVAAMMGDELTEKQRDGVLWRFQPPDVLPSEGSSTPDTGDDETLSDEELEEITKVDPETMKNGLRNARDKLKKLLPEECVGFLS